MKIENFNLDMKKHEYKILNNIKKPTGEIFLVYFSSKTNNTHRFIQKLGVSNIRIPQDILKKIEVNKDFVIICPTFSGGGEFWQGAIPKQVINFLNNKKNRKHCTGVIGVGNTNFGNTFALSGRILSQKINVPLLFQFELLGTIADVKKTKKILLKFWNKGE